MSKLLKFMSEVLDSEAINRRGQETEFGGYGLAMVPSGASTGENEAVEPRDGTKPPLGKGVLKAVDNVNVIIAPAVMGHDVFDQVGIDHLMIKLRWYANQR